MRKLAILAAAAAVVSAFPALAQSPSAPLTPAGWNHGCFRWGETGNHWYSFCLGPDFFYPHRKTCNSAGWCTFR
jgi:hypothetical protein